ncbi:MAG: hypothetical protein IIA14_04210 [SAR324 cluster bacterium]|nr:hypothetical protein [SAR324 cluster bacterium]
MIVVGLVVAMGRGGGSGEVAEDIIRTLRDRYDDLAVIVPGWAKSAATIMAMAGNEILMSSTSAVGPIDAQLSWQGKNFSADALLEGMDQPQRLIVLLLQRALIGAFDDIEDRGHGKLLCGYPVSAWR